MSSMIAESEAELEHELTHEFHPESEHEGEHEHEAFFNHLAAMGDHSGSAQSLRKVALAAARSALRANARPYPAIEGEAESEAARFKLDASPAERANAAAMMEHAGHAAAEAANEQEAAEHFLPLVGLAAKLVAPKLIGMAGRVGGKLLGKLAGKVGAKAARRLAPRLAGRVLRRAAPRLTRAVGNVTRTLYRNPSTRPLLHAMPRIARGTMASLARRVGSGRRITPRYAVRQFARHAARTLSNPRALRQTYRRSLAWDRRFHRNSGLILGRPGSSWVRAVNATPGFGFNQAAASNGCSCRCVCQLAAARFGSVCPTCGR